VLARPPSQGFFGAHSSRAGCPVRPVDSVARALGWVCVTIIILLSLVPGTTRPESAPALYIQALIGYRGLGALLEHLTAYLGTACLLGLGYRPAAKRLAILAMLLVLAALLEMAQDWVPGRSARLRDFGASSIGACVGLLAVSATTLLRRLLAAKRGTPEDRKGDQFASRPALLSASSSRLMS
jgi:hypothetical protein